MPAELVVAGAPYKLWPGGIIALRASDWLGAARGTLSTESDADSIEGTVVRDTQTVAPTIRTDYTNAFAAADDTLTIDLADLPIEAGFPAFANIGMTYQIFVSIKIEGDWDPTNTNTLLGSNEHEFDSACASAWYGGVQSPLESNMRPILYKPRVLERYMITQYETFSSLRSNDGTGTLHMRFYAQAGTTIEWLIDQVILVPYVFQSGAYGNGWRIGDFVAIGGTYDVSVDGADGGDANGKFTWQPNAESYHDASTELSIPGGGDYQHKDDAADAEYASQIPSTFQVPLVNTLPSPDIPTTSGYCYGIHGARYRPARVHIADDFSRTVNAGLTQPGAFWTTHINDEGYTVWAEGTDTGGAATYAAVNGTYGILHMGGQIERSAGAEARYGFKPLGMTGAGLRMPQNIQFSGEMQVSGNAWIGGTTSARTHIKFFDPAVASFAIPEYGILLNHVTDTWSLVEAPGIGSEQVLAGPFDISSWFDSLGNPSVWLGFRLELKRYLLRARIWDASGAEPSTWDGEVFRSIRTNPALGGTWVDYDYADDLGVAMLEMHHRYAGISSGHGTTTLAAIAQWETRWDNFVIEEDPYGDLGDITAYVEQPETGSPVFTSEITVPGNADHFVYWGRRNWTEEDAGSPGDGPIYLDFAAKTWNDMDAAELQYAGLPLFWFRSTRIGNLVPMNWRSGQRPGSIQRILVGRK